MLKYMGSKRRVAKELAAVLEGYRKPGQPFVSPFCGSCAVEMEMRPPVLASDANPYLIALLTALRDGWVPPTEVSEDFYKDVRACKALYEPHLVGFVGFGCSFGGRWFEGYARGKTKDGSPRNYAAEGSRGCTRDARRLKSIELWRAEYDELELPERALIYCDPPYQGTKKYGVAPRFDHAAFWQWVRDRSAEGHTVLVSEYAAPEDFKMVWHKELNVNLNNHVAGVAGRATEKLFKWNPFYQKPK